MPRRGGDDGGDGGGGHGERWEMALTAVREEEAEGGRGRGGGGFRENVLRLVVMATSWLTMLSPMLSQGIRQRRTVCVQKVFWDSESVHKKHAQSCCVRTGSTRVYAPPRFAHRHACCYTLRHAFASHPPHPPPTHCLNGTALLGTRGTRPRGPEGQTAVQERKSLNARCVQNLFHARTLIFTCFLWVFFFSLHKCKIHAFTFPQVQPHPILCRIALFFFSFLNCMIQ